MFVEFLSSSPDTVRQGCVLPTFEDGEPRNPSLELARPKHSLALEFASCPEPAVQAEKRGGRNGVQRHTETL